MAITTTNMIKQKEHALQAGTKQASLNISVISSNNIKEIKTEWRYLESLGVQSPGQNYDFVAQWIDSFEIKPSEQYFSVVKLDNQPIAIFALQLFSKLGIKTLMPFSGYQVGVGAPLIDASIIAKLNEIERKQIWRAAIEPFKGTDLIHFPYVPDEISGNSNLFYQLGISAPADMLYRAKFDSWEQCNIEQRTRSRRKHDKQQSAKLNALGDVAFEEIAGSNSRAKDIIKIMFEQRTKRFKAQGIKNPFNGQLQKFYYDAANNNGNLKVILHVLYLNREIVAVRYNIVHQNRIFCLISSMSSDEKVQAGSPGKQNLLRVMQTIFENSDITYDMGAGLTDEKRHWCNIKISLRHYYIPLSFFAQIIAQLHRLSKTIRFHVKNSKKLGGFLKKLRKNFRSK